MRMGISAHYLHAVTCFCQFVSSAFPRSTCMPASAGGVFRFLFACHHLLLPVCQILNFRAVFACRHLLVGISAQYLHADTCCCQFVSSGISAQ